MNVFEKVTALFQSVEKAVEIANACDRAYAIGVGHPEYHTPFGQDNPQMVAMNLAGLYAADTAAHLLGGYRGQITENDYREALHMIVMIVAGSLDDEDLFLVKNCANLAWRSGQPFRDLATKPLNRITREINKPFALLPPDEENKDLIQVVEGAKQLLNCIDAEG